jgi:SAM-dependent methyltransferase
MEMLQSHFRSVSMTSQAHDRKQAAPDYSFVDVDPMFRSVTRLGIAGLVLSGLLRYVLPMDRWFVADILFGLSLMLLIPKTAVLLLFGRYAGRPRYQARDQIVAAVPWRGDEWVLDVPTGSGFMLLGCAQKLTTGKAIGVDLWLPGYGGGTAERFLNNIRAEGLSERVESRTMDARRMTFEDATFDVVISSFGVSHIGRNPAEREQVIRDMLRVLKPGGTLALYDMAMGVNESLRTLRQLGVKDASQRGVLVKLLIARKPAA